MPHPDSLNALVLQRGENWAGSFAKAAASILTDVMSASDARVVVIADDGRTHLNPIRQVADGRITFADGTTLDLMHVATVIVH